MAKEPKEPKKPKSKRLAALWSGWKDPARRPRYIIWTGVVVLALVGFVVFAFGATSTYFFCNELCHSVQDDAMNTYRLGPHVMVNCLSCHEPVNADPITFAYYKAKAGIVGAYQLYTNTNETPLNPESELALNKHHMGSEQCTQCHSENRVITPSKGIIIDHDVHEEKEIHCTICHNRTAHPEDDYEMVCLDPKTGEVSEKHADFMTMTACFRCHSLTEPPPDGMKAPGTCSACHPADFDLKPANHKEAGFFPKGHAELALLPLDHSTGRPSEEVKSDEPTGTTESQEPSGTAEAEEEAAEHEESEYTGSGAEENIFPISPVEEVDYCSTCHLETFCTDCHGMEMPHSEEFKTKTHPELVATKYDKCQMCHAPETTFFCEKCHHGTQVGWEYDTTADWRTQHGRATVEKGVSACTTTCHEVQFCIDCHAAEQPVPTSHEAADWLHKDLTVTMYPDTPAVASAKHALDAQKSIDSCDICHGPGGVAAKFCADCHKIEIPHPETFKTNHVTGRDTPTICANCHRQKELCSDCHHQGAVNGTPWQKQHPVTVASSGADGCFQQCHENKQFCVDCHMELDAVPTSHEATDWTKRASIDQPAKHQVAYKDSAESCTYCHGEGGVTAQFCVGCHQIEMPHPSDFKDTHKADFEAKKYNQDLCDNCHVQYFCDRCHHEGAVEAQPWRTYHPNIVKQGSADPCFECHEETECSYCHVRL